MGRSRTRSSSPAAKRKAGQSANVCDVAPAPAIRPRRIPGECLNPQRDRIPWRQYLNLKQAKTDQESHKTLRDVGDEKKLEKTTKIQNRRFTIAC